MSSLLCLLLGFCIYEVLTLFVDRHEECHDIQLDIGYCSIGKPCRGLLDDGIMRQKCKKCRYLSIGEAK